LTNNIRASDAGPKIAHTPPNQSNLAAKRSDRF
jgi:hypothetical protein